MAAIRASRIEKLHREEWRDAHNWEMALVLSLQKAGYTRDQARRMADNHRRGEALLTNDNGGPVMDLA